MNRRFLCGGAILLALVSLSLAGCSNNAKTEVSASEQANWKGGPMPADYHPKIGAGPPKAAAPAAPAAPVTK